MPRILALAVLAALFLALDAAVLHRLHGALPAPAALLAALPPSVAQRAQALGTAVWTPPVARAYGAATGHLRRGYSGASAPAARWYASAQAHAGALRTLAHGRSAQLCSAAEKHAQHFCQWAAQRVPPSLAGAVRPVLLQAHDPAHTVSGHLLRARAHARAHWPIYAVAAQAALIALLLVSRVRTAKASGGGAPAAPSAPDAAGTADTSVDIPARYQLHHHADSPDTTLVEDEGAPAPPGTEPVASTPVKAKANGNGTANGASALLNGNAALDAEKRSTATGGSDKPLPSKPTEQKPKTGGTGAPTTASASAASSAPTTPAKASHPPSAFKARTPRDDGDSRSILKRSGTGIRKLRHSLRRSSGEVFGRTRPASLSPAAAHEGDSSFDVSADTQSVSPLRKGTRSKRLSALILGDRKN